MTDEDLCFTPAVALLDEMRRGALSSAELTAAVLARIGRLEPRLNAFVTLLGDEAMAAARTADDERARGGDRPLLGVPVTIKDLQSLAGVPLRSGSHTTESVVPERDAPFVARLKDAGAVILGKTTTPEFGWKGVSESPLTGVTSNPWRPGYNAGGIVRRGRRRRGSGLRSAAPGLGRRRVNPDAGTLLRCVRPQTDLRAHPQLAGTQQRSGLPYRAAHPDRRGCRAHAEGDGGTRHS